MQTIYYINYKLIMILNFHYYKYFNTLIKSILYFSYIKLDIVLYLNILIKPVIN